MSPQEMFNAVRDEFGEFLAIHVVAIYTLQLGLKPKLADFSTPGRFEARLRKKATKQLWQLSAPDFDKAFAITMALYDFDVSHALQGTGGCKPRTLTQILQSASDPAE